MRVSVETTGGLERKLSVALPSDSFEEQVVARLKDTARRVRLPGFRPGRVPMKEVRRRFGQSVRSEVAGEMIDRSFSDAVAQESLAPVGAPTLEIVNIDPGADLEYSATFEVLPSFDLADLGGLELERLEAEITDEDVERMIESLRERAGVWVEVERAAADGDRVTYSAKRSDPAGSESDTTSDLQVVVGAGQVPRIEDAVRGLEAGEETEFNLADAGDAGDAEDAAEVKDAAEAEDAAEAADVAEADPNDDEDGEEPQTAASTDDAQAGEDDPAADPLAWRLTVSKVEQLHLPDVDEAFFTAYGVQEGGEEAFRDNVRENMQARLDEALRRILRSEVMRSLGEAHDFPLPAALVADAVERQRQEFRLLGGDPEQLPSEPLTMSAEQSVRVQLVVREIVQQSGLEADATRLRERIDEYAQSFDDPEAVVNYIYGNDEQLDRFEARVLEEQVVDHVVDQAQVSTAACSYMEALARASAPQAHDPGEDDEAPQQPGHG